MKPFPFMFAMQVSKKAGGCHPGRPFAPFLPVALSCLLIQFLPAPVHAGTPVDFTDAQWNVALGLEFPGAVGNAWVAKMGEKSSLILQGDFRKGGAYVGWIRKFPPNPDVQKLKLELRTREVSFLVFRATDATGQTFQQKFPLDDRPSLQTLVIDDFAGAKNHGNSWGGKKDGAWHGPLSSIALLVDKGNLRPTGEAMGKVELGDLWVE